MWTADNIPTLQQSIVNDPDFAHDIPPSVCSCDFSCGLARCTMRRKADDYLATLTLAELTRLTSDIVAIGGGTDHHAAPRWREYSVGLYCGFVTVVVADGNVAHGQLRHYWPDRGQFIG